MTFEKFGINAIFFNKNHCNSPPQVTEAEMQHGDEVALPPSPESSASSDPTEGQILAQAETLGPTEVKAWTTVASPEQPELLRFGEGDKTGPEEKVVVKKSHSTLRGSGRAEERPETTLAAEEYGYIVTDQK